MALFSITNCLRPGFDEIYFCLLSQITRQKITEFIGEDTSHHRLLLVHFYKNRFYRGVEICFEGRLVATFYSSGFLFFFQTGFWFSPEYKFQKHKTLFIRMGKYETILAGNVL